MSLVIEEKEIDSLPITVDPDILGGTPVFRGTRVPVDALLNNLEAARTKTRLNFRYDRCETLLAESLPLAS